MKKLMKVLSNKGYASHTPTLRKPKSRFMNAPTRKPVKEEVGRAGDKQGLSIQSPLVALEYFRANLVNMIAKYEGEYVAIIEDKIIAHGRDVKKVYQEAKDKFPKKVVFLGQVPRKEALIL